MDGEYTQRAERATNTDAEPSRQPREPQRFIPIGKRVEAGRAEGLAADILRRTVERFRAEDAIAPIREYLEKRLADCLKAHQLFAADDPRVRFAARFGDSLTLVTPSGHIMHALFMDHPNGEDRCPVSGAPGLFRAPHSRRAGLPLSPFSKAFQNMLESSGAPMYLARTTEVNNMLSNESENMPKGQRRINAVMRSLDITIMRGARKSASFASFALRRAVDPEDFKLADRAMRWDADFHAWINGEQMEKEETSGRRPIDAFFADEDAAARLERARNRRQAVSERPILAETFMLSEITKAIDDGRSLEAALREDTPIDRAMFAAARGLSWRTATGEGQRRAVSALRVATIANAPRTRPEWTAALSASAVVEGFPGDKTLATAFLAPAAGHWAEMARAHKEEPFGGILDAVRDLDRQLVAPALKLRGGDVGSAFEMTRNKAIMGEVLRSGLPSVARFNAAWHRRRPRLHLDLAELNIEQEFQGAADSWPALMGVVASESLGLPKGLRARELNSASALREEGNRMHHCVGGYVGSVLRGHCVIFAIEDAETGAPLSTLEVRRNQTAPNQDRRQDHRQDRRQDPRHSANWREGQNQAPGNTTPPKNSANFAALLIPKVAEAAEKNPEYFKKAFARIKALDPDRPCFGDPDPQRIEAAFALWRPILPKGLERKGCEAFIDRCARAVARCQEEENNERKEPIFSRRLHLNAAINGAHEDIAF